MLCRIIYLVHYHVLQYHWLDIKRLKVAKDLPPVPARSTLIVKPYARQAPVARLITITAFPTSLAVMQDPDLCFEGAERFPDAMGLCSGWFSIGCCV